MAVYDRWHRDPRDGEQPCKCGRGRNKLYPSAVHGRGDRWQVQYEEPNTGKRPKKNFALRDPAPGELPDPDRHASAYDALMQGKIVTRTYADPNAGNVLFRDYAEDWRKSRRAPNPETAENTERSLRLHVYPVIGHHSLALLAARPSVIAAWAAGIRLAPGPARALMGLVSRVFRAAMSDGAVTRDPVRADGVDRPEAPPKTARAWSLAQLEAVRRALPLRWRVLPDLGAGTGMRQGEMLALGTDDVDWLVSRDPRVRVERQLRKVGGKFVFAPVKNRKVHDVPLTETVKARLAAHLETFPAVSITLPWFDPADKDRHGQPVTVRLIITSPSRGPVHSTTLANTWTAAVRRTGVTPPGGRVRDDGCHALRHTFASTQLRAGTDVVRVAAWLGDTVEMVTSTYLHLLPDGDDGDGRAAVEAFFGGSGERAGTREVPDEQGEQAK
jgi:integrase